MSTADSSTATSAPKRAKVHYAWVVFAVTFVTLLGASGFRSAPGVLIEPLQDDFGWSKATISVAISINLILYGLIGPFAAALMGRFGLRKVVITALIVVSSGALATTAITHPWQLWLLWGVVVGTGSGCMATVLAATVANRWFVARKGIVTGALTAAGATGQLVFLPVLSRVATDIGWETVAVIVGGSALAVVPLVALLLRNQPSDVGLSAYGADESWQQMQPTTNPVRAAFDGFTQARRSGAFWLLAGSFFVCGASTNGLVGTHFIPAAHDHGLAETKAASLLALVGIFDIAGTLASGWLTDRVEPRRLLRVYYGFRGLSLLALHQALDASSMGLWAFIIFYGLDWVATVPPTVALCTEVFGPRRATVVYGWVFAGHQLGAAFAAFGAGKIRDVTGSYQAAFVISGVLCLVAAAGVTRIGREPHLTTRAESLVPDLA
ncbi:MAG: MFS transporter [Acidimicrobiia bacterium]